MNEELNNNFYKLLKVTLSVKNCKRECPLYRICEIDKGSICEELQEYRDSFLGED